jgi:hypothetical protein
VENWEHFEAEKFRFLSRDETHASLISGDKILMYQRIAKVEIWISLFKRFINTNDTRECEKVITYTAIRFLIVG